ncbi:sulfotransferase family 2 domain-containing protein [Yoonia litorea]|uniref:Sulfotransferase family protein n=1 Tax=Yoonia litorea TaxID=1123755 RepID=A0A1I6KZV7_9RHOB|nr:sulfotransferase family 2 domain-containing protein [Yoonia litorea]SFR96759.1 Sulfotransferase family protein [Yoonia litorea]
MHIIGDIRRAHSIRRWTRRVASGQIDPKDHQCIPIAGAGASVIYIPVPKAANTSIRSAILPCFAHDYDDYDGTIHHHPAIPVKPLRSSLAEIDDPAMMFTVVRHPAERIFSTYRNKMGRGKYFGHAARLGMSKTISFDAFLEILSSVPKSSLDSHFKPQTLLLHYVLDDHRLEIFKTEEIAGHWPDIAQRITDLTGKEPNATLGRLNQTESARRERQWTKHQKNLIEHLYADDFTQFGYEW